MTFFEVFKILFKMIVTFTIVMLGAAYGTYFERKVLAWMHARKGPMHVGYHGLLQPLADFVKLFFKEDIIPYESDKPVFVVAPIVALFPAVLCWAALPLGSGLVVADLNIGVLFVFAISSISTIGVIMAGWASNSKYALLGAIRTVAQVVSYEVAIGFAVVGVLMISGTLNLSKIVAQQVDWPFFILQPVGCIIFFICGLAESARVPFDLPEAESEIVAGYYVEYSGMKFGFFVLMEYIHMLVVCTLGVLLYFGGWNFFWLPIPESLNFLVVIGKVIVLIYIFSWIRATLPRYRYDQLMNLSWKIMFPLALVNIAVTGIVMLLST